MLMLKFMLSLFCVLPFSAKALSGWNGKWLGSGIATNKPNQTNEKNRKCKQIGLQLSVNANSLDWQNGFYICEDLKASYDPTVFQISNTMPKGTLLLNGQPVGSLNADKIEFSIVDSEDGVLFHLLLTFSENGGILYQEEWSKAETILFKVRGSLRRQGLNLN
jgi:hypothetical protein